MTIPTLPAEILVHIAQFLPPECLVRLYGVSKAFMDLAFAAKYGTLNIDSTFWCPVEGRKYVTHLKHLSKQYAARHIRDIKINANFPFDQLRDNILTRCWSSFIHIHFPSVFGPFSPSVSNIFGSGLWRYERFVRSITKLTKVIPAYSNIKSLTLTFPPQHVQRSLGIERLLHVLIPSVAHGIEELRLEGIAETILNAIPPQIKLNSLRSLNIVLKDDDTPLQVLFHREMDGREASLRVAQLINQYADKLVKLSITLPAWSEFDAEAIFTGLSEFPSLDSLCVMVSRWSKHGPVSLFNFISLHASQILHLTIPPPVGMENFEPHRFLPNISSLEVFPPAETYVDIVAIGQLIHHAARTLENLGMDYQALMYMNNIGEVFTTATYPKLRSLRMRIRFLRPYDLMTILEKFPRITRLEILADKLLTRMNTWASRDTITHTEVEEFIQMSRNLNLGKCSTRGIIIWVNSLKQDVDGYDMRYAIPSLESICFKAGRAVM